MKKLTKEEFMKRTEELLRARRIFIPSVTRNISLAFEIYSEIISEDEQQLQLGKERERDYGLLANIQRPICPDCGRELGLRLINLPEGKQNRNGYKSSWVCEDESCCYEKYSKNTLNDWMETLPKKEGDE